MLFPAPIYAYAFVGGCAIGAIIVALAWNYHRE
jgi:hypothetical protein